MLCDRCKKNPAVIHIKEFINGKCRNLTLCKECAEKDGPGLLPDIGLNISEMILEHLPFGKKNHRKNESTDDSLESLKKLYQKNDLEICPACSAVLEDVKKNNQAFCPECYKSFARSAAAILKESLAEELLYRGKRPLDADENSPAVRRNKLLLLQKQLQQFISIEDYESAAQCRDEIAVLQKQSGTDENVEHDNE